MSYPLTGTRWQSLEAADSEASTEAVARSTHVAAWLRGAQRPPIRGYGHVVLGVVAVAGYDRAVRREGRQGVAG